MVYAVSYCPLSKHQEFKKLGFDDSKKLTEEKRIQLAKIIEANKDWIGWAVYVISPKDISTNMFKRPVYNLNEMAHDATIELIKQVVANKINLKEIYVDPVGPSIPYKRKLQSHFPGVAITVEPKADALYPIVSAASICAKVTRDQFIQNWEWTETGLQLSKKFGSGYPSDPNTVRWMDENEDPFFGFPSIMRFSWKTITQRMIQKRNIEWSEDEDDEFEHQQAITKRVKKILEEKMAIKEKLRKKASKYNHHQKGKINSQFSLDTTQEL
ncbi:ribonuclease H-like domain-containing protein [Cokeromyces recurvatus]|uniref:ribonuclease H-like domain-containing protein n=1 Tax=Cokeromyces recurvatus TaxID=90255 RepID=UPI0022204CCA|nr:ribonuclease H-like domain-containing protein [Cokeromyces recurvatus]KAI7903156.1 ribonuclease H-like domain-containing protein [Cokeromyces recurvatus]